MCIIIAKTKTQKAPKIEILKTCFENNPDGAGFMYTDNNRVIIDKGYMTEKALIKRYKYLKHKYNNFKNKSLVIHFRISTSGEITGAFTHPFIITDNIKDMKKEHTSAKIGVAHNGILTDYTPKNKNVNDTMLFIKRFLYNKFKNKKLFTDSTRKQIEKTGSRFAILTKNDNLHLYGDFIKDGVFYSNSTYKKDYYTTFYNTYKYNYYDGLMIVSDYDIMIYEGYTIEARYFKTRKKTQLYYDWYNMRLYEMDGADVVSFTDCIDIEF